MTRTHQLETSLWALSLSGMLDTLEARLAQAHAGELGHLEFLQVLCEDEVARREAATLHRRVRAARFEQVVTLEDFDFSFNPKVPTAQIRDLATLAFLEAGESVILHGPVGVGKSHVAQALGPCRLPSGLHRGVHQDLPPAGRPGRWPCRSQLGRPASSLGQAGGVDTRRLRHARLQRRPGR